MKSIQALREQRKKLAADLRSWHDNLADDHTWSDEDQQRYDETVAQIEALDKKIDRQQQVIDIDAARVAAVEGIADEDGISVDEATARAAQDKDIFVTWIREGINGLSPEQAQRVRQRVQEARIQGAMSTGVPAEGGNLVPRELAATLIQAMKAFGGVREVADSMDTATGAAFDMPTTDATSEEGEIVGENQSVTSGDTTFGLITIGAYKYSSKSIALPFELLQDSAIDIEAYIINLLAMRIARITNRHFTVGTGTSQPEGVNTAAPVGKVGTTGQTTAVTFDDLVDLIHSVDPAYRQSGRSRLMFHDQTLRYLKQIKKNNDDNRPLWLPGVATGDPDTIYGYGYTINQNMPVMAASEKSILFGDFTYYKVRNVMDMMMFRMTDSKYTEKGQVGFLGFMRGDGKLADVGGAIKAYQNSAT